MGYRWIVIIDKAPRGPLTESEVKALLDQKIIRTNDVAFKVEEGESGQKSEWKFLWQFSEFDRRKPKEETPEPPDERRTQKNKDQLLDEKHALLPHDLAAIQPEDLVYTRAHSERKTELPDKLPPLQLSPKGFSFQWKWLTPIPLVVMMLYVAFGPETPTQDSPSQKTDKVSANSEDEDDPIPTRSVSQIRVPGKPEMKLPIRDQHSSTSPSVLTEKPISKPEIKLPKEEDKEKGDISYEEYRRRQDEQLQKDQEEEEYRKAEVEEEEGYEESPAKKKKKAIKKRRAASEEDMDSEEGDLIEEEEESER